MGNACCYVAVPDVANNFEIAPLVQTSHARPARPLAVPITLDPTVGPSHLVGRERPRTPAMRRVAKPPYNFPTIVLCPAGPGMHIPEVEDFAYVRDLWRKQHVPALDYAATDLLLHVRDAAADALDAPPQGRQSPARTRGGDGGTTTAAARSGSLGSDVAVAASGTPAARMDVLAAHDDDDSDPDSAVVRNLHHSAKPGSANAGGASSHRLPDDGAVVDDEAGSAADAAPTESPSKHRGGRGGSLVFFHGDSTTPGSEPATTDASVVNNGWSASPFPSTQPEKNAARAVPDAAATDASSLLFVSTPQQHRRRASSQAGGTSPLASMPPTSPERRALPAALAHDSLFSSALAVVQRPPEVLNATCPRPSSLFIGLEVDHSTAATTASAATERVGLRIPEQPTPASAVEEMDEATDEFLQKLRAARGLAPAHLQSSSSQTRTNPPKIAPNGVAATGSEGPAFSAAPPRFDIAAYLTSYNAAGDAEPVAADGSTNIDGFDLKPTELILSGRRSATAVNGGPGASPKKQKRTPSANLAHRTVQKARGYAAAAGSIDDGGDVDLSFATTAFLVQLDELKGRTAIASSEASTFRNLVAEEYLGAHTSIHAATYLTELANMNLRWRSSAIALGEQRLLAGFDLWRQCAAAAALVDLEWRVEGTRRVSLLGAWAESRALLLVGHRRQIEALAAAAKERQERRRKAKLDWDWRLAQMQVNTEEEERNPVGAAVTTSGSVRRMSSGRLLVARTSSTHLVASSVFLERSTTLSSTSPTTATPAPAIVSRGSRRKQLYAELFTQLQAEEARQRDAEAAAYDRATSAAIEEAVVGGGCIWLMAAAPAPLRAIWAARKAARDVAADRQLRAAAAMLSVKTATPEQLVLEANSFGAARFGRRSTPSASSPYHGAAATTSSVPDATVLRSTTATPSVLVVDGATTPTSRATAHATINNDHSMTASAGRDLQQTLLGARRAATATAANDMRRRLCVSDETATRQRLQQQERAAFDSIVSAATARRDILIAHAHRRETVLLARFEAEEAAGRLEGTVSLTSLPSLISASSVVAAPGAVAGNAVASHEGVAGPNSNAARASPGAPDWRATFRTRKQRQQAAEAESKLAAGSTLARVARGLQWRQRLGQVWRAHCADPAAVELLFRDEAWSRRLIADTAASTIDDLHGACAAFALPLLTAAATAAAAAAAAVAASAVPLLSGSDREVHFSVAVGSASTTSVTAAPSLSSASTVVSLPGPAAREAAAKTTHALLSTRLAQMARVVGARGVDAMHGIGADEIRAEAAAAREALLVWHAQAAPWHMPWGYKGRCATTIQRVWRGVALRRAVAPGGAYRDALEKRRCQVQLLSLARRALVRAEHAARRGLEESWAEASFGALTGPAPPLTDAAAPSPAYATTSTAPTTTNPIAALNTVRARRCLSVLLAAPAGAVTQSHSQTDEVGGNGVYSVTPMEAWVAMTDVIRLLQRCGRGNLVRRLEMPAATEAHMRAMVKRMMPSSSGLK